MVGVPRRVTCSDSTLEEGRRGWTAILGCWMGNSMWPREGGRRRRVHAWPPCSPDWSLSNECPRPRSSPRNDRPQPEIQHEQRVGYARRPPAHRVDARHEGSAQTCSGVPPRHARQREETSRPRPVGGGGLEVARRQERSRSGAWPTSRHLALTTHADDPWWMASRRRVDASRRRDDRGREGVVGGVATRVRPRRSPGWHRQRPPPFARL